MRGFYKIFIFCLVFISVLAACKKDIDDPIVDNGLKDTLINFTSPKYFPEFRNPANNPLSKRGVELGRMLFYDPVLSSDSSISCASCHNPQYSFSDNRRYSVGVDGAVGNIQAMPLVNLDWQTKLFWNGRSNSLEAQALEPINNPIEMHETSANVVLKLMRNENYKQRFKVVFGSDQITAEMIGKAIAQFERTMISNQSKYDLIYDKIVTSGMSNAFDDSDELLGFITFNNERGQCFHCHGSQTALLAHNLDTLFRNNGLLTDAQMLGKGVAEITGKPEDEGFFKVPILRNIELTAPYMHDGRFNTLEQVVEFYSSGIQQNRNLDINFSKNPNRLEQFGGLGLTDDEKRGLVKFLKTLTDTSFTKNKAFSNPFN